MFLTVLAVAIPIWLILAVAIWYFRTEAEILEQKIKE